MYDLNQIYHKDCLEGLREMPDNSVDCVITSPPYNIGNSVRGNLYGEYKDSLSDDAYFAFICNVVRELIRVNRYYCFFNFQLLKSNKNAYLRILNEFKHNIKDIIIWHKIQAAPAVQPTCLTSAFEFIIVFTKPEMAENRSFERAFFNNREKGQNTRNIIYGNNASVHELNMKKGENKATFPQYLVKWFIDRFTQRGDIVLDPFMGSGTTAFVSRQEFRKYIGFEIDIEQINIANERLSQKPLQKFIDDTL